MEKNYRLNVNTKSLLRIGGKMSEKGANAAGIILAVSALVAASGLAIAAVAWALQ